MNKNIESITVHGGVFHADDVACVAIAKILNESVAVRRVFRAEGLENSVDSGNIVADIGGGQFDHHQKDCPEIKPGIKHCAATRMWEVYGEKVIEKIFPQLDEVNISKTANSVCENILIPIALEDNGAEKSNVAYSVCDIVASFNPNWDETETADNCFDKAVEVMEQILIRAIKEEGATQKGKSIVREAISHEENGVVVLPHFVPWRDEVVANENVKMVVFPSLRGGYNLQMAPTGVGFATRIAPPSDWYGTAGTEAEEKFPGMTFCHANGFMCSFTSKEAALNAAAFINSIS